MCGIVGYITNEDQIGLLRREKFMRQALIMDTLRGRDSTGIFGVIQREMENNCPGWFKQIGGGMEFVDSDDYSEFEKNIYKYCIGHNRAATVGDVTVNNAHPFQEGPITLVHNGSLWSTSLLPKTIKELGVDVDSHAICHNLAIAPVEEVIPRLDGAFALVWHDARDDSLNIVRNGERPLHMAQAKNEDTIFIMSEAEMLYAITSRLKYSIEDIVFPRPGQWLKFFANDLKHPEIKQLDLSGRTQYYGGYYNYGYWDHEDSSPFKGDSTIVELRPGKDKGGQRSPQPRASGDNKVRVGGMLRNVPIRAQELLLDLDLMVESRLSFIPVSTSRTEIKGRVVVTGYAGKEGMTAIIYNINKDLFDRCKNRIWTVRPIAVKYMDVDEPAVICKIVSTMGKGLTEEERSQEIPSQQRSEVSSEAMVRGAHGVYITRSEFLEQTGHGCIQCGRALCIEDADDITWVNDGRDPLCASCLATYEEEYGEMEEE